MNTVLTVLHVVVCFFLVAVVLLQRGKGAEMGAVFGGGASSTVFGSRGGANFLSKMTTGSAALFMITSLSLSYIATDQAGDRLFEDGVTEEAGAETENAAGGFEDLGTVAPESVADDAGVLTNEATAEAAEAAPAEAEPAGEAAPDTPKP
ncbi:MAG: preprotein translocase subunit SecG [Deltaproteobacteria bacterium]|nr:preprotein translocase subunit SecG [Deltaproteobacteria bacterium]